MSDWRNPTVFIPPAGGWQPKPKMLWPDVWAAMRELVREGDRYVLGPLWPYELRALAEANGNVLARLDPPEWEAVLDDEPDPAAGVTVTRDRRGMVTLIASTVDDEPDELPDDEAVTCWWCEGDSTRDDGDGLVGICPICDGEGVLSAEQDRLDTVDK